MNEREEKWALLQTCRRDIEERLSEKIDPEKLAASYGYAYSTFRKLFREITGYSVHHYIRLRRLFRAARVLRETGRISEAVEIAGFETLSGFNKAFLEEYGVSSSQYAASRGRILMREPELAEKPGFYVVGWAFETGERRAGKEEELGAFWLGRDFPWVSDREYKRIGGGPDTVGLWIGPPGEGYYLIGPTVPRQSYVPSAMEAAWVPGGCFARFRLPEAARNQELSEAVHATWFYALRQWLPESPWTVDRKRLSYEYYLNGENSIFVPVKRRTEDRAESGGNGL